jgi:hypothetical protein
LDQDEVIFLKKLHSEVFFKDDRGKVHLKYGVHQGSALSPALFNIYFEKVIEEFKRVFPEKFFYSLFADDLVFICKVE